MYLTDNFEGGRTRFTHEALKKDVVPVRLFFVFVFFAGPGAKVRDLASRASAPLNSPYIPVIPYPLLSILTQVAGKAVFFPCFDAERNVAPLESRHEARPVLSGRKYIATIWTHTKVWRPSA